MEKTSSLEDYLTTSDIAEMFDVPVRQVQYYIKKGLIQTERLGNSKYFYVIHKDHVPKAWPPA